MPDWRREVSKRLSDLKLLPARESQIVEELTQHLQDRYQELLSANLSEAEATRLTLQELSDDGLLAKGLRRVEEESPRDPVVVGGSRGDSFAANLWQDISYGLRQFRRSPGFSAVAVLTLALGIAANTAIFSMVNGMILRTLPYRQPEQLYVINENVPQLTGQSPWGPLFPVNPANFLLWQGHCPAISSMALIEAVTFNMTGQGTPRQLNAARVSANFFSLTGITPQLGRDFLTQEDQLGQDHEVILTAQIWREVFHSDPEIIGKSMVLDNSAYVVVGVTPDSFRFPEIPHLGNYAPEIFKPIGFQPWESWPGIGGFNFQVIARLKPGASPSQALAQLDVAEAAIAQRGDAHRGIAPGQFDLKTMVRPLKTAILEQAPRALGMLMVAAGFVLLIICLNLANLMLVRNIGRAHEVAVRSALGASRRSLLRQFFVEALIVAAAGGVSGLLFAGVALQALVKNAPLSIPRLGDIQIDSRVLFFTASVTFATAVLFAFFPTSRLVKVSPLETLGSSSRIASGGPQALRLRSGLVVSQIALCGVLLAGALLLIESLVRVERANAWMDEEHVLALDLSIPPNESNSVQQVDQFLSNVLARVRVLPGVQKAGFTSKLPLLGDSFGDDIDFREAPQPPGKPQIGQYRFVSPGYFQTIGLSLIKGRLLSESDRDKDVALISESIAERLLPGRDPIGMHLLWDGQGPPKPREIIGIVADVRNTSDHFPLMTAYLPLWTFYQSSETLVVRTAIDPSGVLGSIRRAIWNVDPVVAIPRERTLKAVVVSSEAVRRYESYLGALFAAFAVLLAALGLYGVMAYSVSQRTHEIGIRVALGAQRGAVVRLVVGHGAKLALLGVGIGMVAASGLTRLMTSLLFGTSATDPPTFAAVAMVLIGVALLACYIPARRAMRVDPMVALRYE